MSEMTITRGLSELKLLDKRICDKINSSNFVGCAKRASDKVNNAFTKAKFKELIKSNYSSINDLIKRRNQIKSAIVESNAKTIVTISGIEMTVAEAIERKSTIQYEENLLEKMTSQYNKTVAKCNDENTAVSLKANDMVNTMLGKVEQAKKDQYKADSELVQKFISDNEFEFVDSISIYDEIQKLKEKIEGFKNEVDYILSENNSIIKINISD